MTRLCLFALCACAGAKPVPDAELKGVVREMLDAVAPGHWEVWDRYTDDAVLYTSENGQTMTKAELHADFGPLPKGYTGSLQTERFEIRVHGDTAIVVHHDHERMNVLGHAIEARYIGTDTYVRKGGAWKMVATQVHAVLADPPVGAVDRRRFDEYVGTYELAPEVRTAVTREGDRLFAERSGRPKQELLPEAEGVFFVAGAPRSRKIFVRGPDGKVSALADRRDGRDLVWRRQP